jgi:hypothetical protein
MKSEYTEGKMTFLFPPQVHIIHTKLLFSRHKKLHGWEWSVCVRNTAIQLVTVTLNSNPRILFKIRFTFIPHSTTYCGRTYRHCLPTVTKGQCIRVHLQHITDIPFHEELSVFYGKQISITIFKSPIQLWSCFMHLLRRRCLNFNKTLFQPNFQEYNIQCHIVT